MRVSLHTVICCCVFTTVVPMIRGDPEETSGTLKKRFREWLQTHLSRDRHTQINAAGEAFTAETSQNKDGETALQSPSFGGNLRSKRSSGCKLATCIIHDLVKNLNQSNVQKPCAPKKKMGPGGFGRRRRSVAEDPQLTLQTDRPGTSSEPAEQDNDTQSPCSKD